ncbi:armadillo-type fold protein, partial [Tanacetum coccineum]
ALAWWHNYWGCLVYIRNDNGYGIRNGFTNPLERIEEMQVKKENEKSGESSLSAVDDLVGSLDEQRLYREVTLALRTGLRDARSDFSFLRLHGLRNILKFMRSVADNDSIINLFIHTQSIPSL